VHKHIHDSLRKGCGYEATKSVSDMLSPAVLAMLLSRAILVESKMLPQRAHALEKSQPNEENYDQQVNLCREGRNSMHVLQFVSTPTSGHFNLYYAIPFLKAQPISDLTNTLRVTQNNDSVV
jgi:hypothetical protein